MRTQQLLGIAILPLVLVSCAKDQTDQTEGTQEHLDEARSALEQHGHQFRSAFEGHGEDPQEGTTTLPSEEEAVAIFVSCGGVDQGPTFFLDDVELGTIPCSEEGEVNEVVTDYAYTDGELELRTEGSSDGAQWAFAVGVTSEEEDSDSPE